jgi:DNA-binding LacI/PurR family transcriptional regulator
MAQDKKATILDVAKLAKVSKATVSKFINDIPYVSSATQKKIEHAIKELNFHPNSLARGLVNRSIKLIGLVVSDFDIMINMELIKSIETEAQRNGYNVVLANVNLNELGEEKIPAIFGDQHLDGVILANARVDDVQINKLQKMFQYIVMVHRHFETDAIDYTVIDGYLGGRLAVEYLIGLGHKHIAMIKGPKSIAQFVERERGFLDALKENGLEEQGYVIETNQTLEDGYRAAENIVYVLKKPTAIFASTDILALGVLEAAREYRWKVPGDLSLIGFDNIFFSKLARIPLTTIDARVKELAENSVRLLMERIQGVRSEVNQIKLPPSLIVRESCGKLGVLV